MRYFVSFLLITMLVSCHKKEVEEIKEVEEVDYRDKYTGTFRFTGYYYQKSWSGDDYPDIEKFDTIIVDGSIVKYDTNKLKIIFKDTYSEPDIESITFPVVIDGLAYVTITDSGAISYPEFYTTGQQWFEGKFFNNDSLSFEYGISAHVGTQDDKIYGQRID